MKYIKLFTGTRRLGQFVKSELVYPLMIEIGRYKNLETEERLFF